MEKDDGKNIYLGNHFILRYTPVSKILYDDFVVFCVMFFIRPRSETCNGGWTFGIILLGRSFNIMYDNR
jgi:hypothetical protein